MIRFLKWVVEKSFTPLPRCQSAHEMAVVTVCRLLMMHVGAFFVVSLIFLIGWLTIILG